MALASSAEGLEEPEPQPQPSRASTVAGQMGDGALGCRILGVLLALVIAFLAAVGGIALVVRVLASRTAARQSVLDVDAGQPMSSPVP